MAKRERRADRLPMAGSKVNLNKSVQTPLMILLTCHIGQYSDESVWQCHHSIGYGSLKRTRSDAFQTLEKRQSRCLVIGIHASIHIGFQDSIVKVDEQLPRYAAPVLPYPGPFFGDIDNGQLK